MTISKELLFASCAEFGVQINDACADRLDLYAKLLIEYNEKVNLTAITQPDEIVRKHFADSLLLLRYVDIQKGTRYADIGTGGGFPGAVLLCAVPDAQAVLVDSINKKLDFIRFLLRELGLKGEVLTARAEELGRKGEYRETFDVVTARAVAQLNQLSEYCMPLVKVGGVFAPMKGKLEAEEQQRGFGAIANLGGKVEKNIELSLDGAQRHIVVAKKISQTPTKYPRNQAQILKKPL